MEARGARQLSLWTSLSLLLISGVVVVTTNTYSVGNPVTLDIPKCQLKETDSVEWKKGKERLRRKKPSESQLDLDEKCNCRILPNGSLYLQRLEKEGDTTYTIEVHDSEGKLKCNHSVTVTGQYSVVTPSISYVCKEKKQVEVNCSMSQGSAPELHLTLDGRPRKKERGKFLSSAFTIKAVTNLTCTAKNQLNEASYSLMIGCEEGWWEWYLYVAAAAGGVAFIIFIVLIVYSVRSCKRPRETPGETPGEEVMYNNQRYNIQERQLPQPPTAAPQRVAITDETECSSQEPPPHKQGAPHTAPGGKRERRTRAKPPEPPNGPPESLPLVHQGPAPQQTRPPLPGNHPNDQAPRPTPRTKSKPPRQNRQRH